MFINICCSWPNKLFIKSNSIRSFLTTAAKWQKNYYEILGLKNDCTHKQIRSAFLILSKKHHPDMKNEGGTGKASGERRSNEFIKAMEAYQVLSKPHSRANYDLSLRGIDRINYIQRDTYHEPWKDDPLRRYTGNESYYGVSGLKKVKHWKIVVICVLFCVFGAMLQAFAIFRSSAMYRREIPDYKSALNSEAYSEARDRAERNGNTLQIEMMKHQLKKSYLDTDKGEV